MATRNIVPRGDGEGSVGTSTKRWGDVRTKQLNGVDAAPMAGRSNTVMIKRSTLYTVGTTGTVPGLPIDWIMICTTSGTTADTDITLPVTLVDGATITDGEAGTAVTWTLRHLLSHGIMGYRQPNTAYEVGNIAYHSALPTGWYLECTTAGTTGSGELTISTTIGASVTDGSVTWRICNVNANTNYQKIAMARHTRTTFTLANLISAVADQNLAKYGIKVGDYYTGASGYTYVVAGLNPLKGTTHYTITNNHCGLIVCTHTTHAWNASGNTSTGADNRGAGYANSDLHYYLVNTVLPKVKSDLGESHLYAHQKLLSNAVNTTWYNRFGTNTGGTSGWSWYSNQYISALTEHQVYGGIAWSSSGHDTGEADQQLEVFKEFKHTDIFGNEYVWLRDVASASYACRATDGGFADYTTASFAAYVAALIAFH